MAAEDYLIGDTDPDEEDFRRATCKHCGKSGLRWDDDGDGNWVLFEGKFEIHKCKHADLARDFEDVAMATAKP